MRKRKKSLGRLFSQITIVKISIAFFKIMFNAAKEVSTKSKEAYLMTLVAFIVFAGGMGFVLQSIFSGITINISF